MFIIWENALYAYVQIIDDIKKHFDIIQIVECKWDADAVASNFSRFYGANLPQKSCKEKECGCGAFKIIIVKDSQPQYEYRNTSKGNKKVNINTFDLKEKYREWTNGGSKIHGTNNTKEFQHDITLLFGLNPNDYLNLYGHLKERHIHQNIIGYNGWESLNQLFYVLSNTIDYVILRGYDIIEKSASSNQSNDDIDILTTEYENAVYIINGKSACSIIRPHQQIEIASKTFYLDLWDFNKGYYDLQWENKMLQSKRKTSEAFVLSAENEFFCLLYHCLINKNQIAAKYSAKLNYYKDNKLNSDLSWENILVQFLSSNDYDIPEPKDPSVGYHISNEIINQYATRNGKLIQAHYFHEYNLFSRIYQNNNTFVKQGSEQILKTERKYLAKLQSNTYFPKILSDTNKSLTLSKVTGNTLKEISDSNVHLSLHQQRKFLLGVIGILKSLYSNKIIHRDFTPSNILIDTKNDECSVHLIDFGWAIQYGEEVTAIEPIGLGEIYRYPEYYSDAYAFAQILKIHFSSYSYLYNSAKLFEKIATIQHPDIHNLDKIHQIISKKFSPLTLAQFHAIDILKKTQFLTITIWRKAIYPLHFRQWVQKTIQIFKSSQ